MLRKFFQIATSLIVIASVLVSCTTRVPEYVYDDPIPLEVPDLMDYIPSEAMALANMRPDIITSPETVNDLIYNMAEYKRYYESEHEIRISLEKYIKNLKKILEVEYEI